MKKMMLLALAPLTLASCNLLGIANGDVSGNILGTQPTEAKRLAMRGLTLAGVQTPSLDQLNLATFNPEKRVYSVSLPNSPSEGGYELFAYVDTTKNNKYDSGEQRTATSTKYFVYSINGLGNKDGSNLLNLKAGWTLMDGLTVVKSGTPFMNFDLNW